MVAPGMKGMAEMLRLFDSLPSATEAELKDDLPKLAKPVLAAQQGVVPVLAAERKDREAGALKAALSIQILGGGFKVRVGLVGAPTGKGANLGGAFYGRFVEQGVLGQVVSVERRRRVGGALRTLRRRKRAEDIVARYSLRVKAQPARPYVDTAASQGAALDGAEQLADFWDAVLTRAGGAFS